MAEKIIKIPGFKCDKCEHEWISKNKKRKPNICPECKSSYWNAGK